MYSYKSFHGGTHDSTINIALLKSGERTAWWTLASIKSQDALHIFKNNSNLQMYSFVIVWYYLRLFFSSTISFLQMNFLK